MLKIFYLFIRNLFFGNNIQYASGYWSALVRKTAGDIVTNSTGTIVEFGCSEGLFLEILSAKNPSAKITGIEISPKTAEFANTRLGSRFQNISVIQGDARNTKFDSSSIDTIFCLNTMPNLNDQQIEKIFSEANRILKINSLFIFEIRNLSNPLMMLQYRFRKYYDPTKLDIVRAYSVNSMKELLEKYGFKIDYIQNIGIFSALKLFVVRKK